MTTAILDRADGPSLSAGAPVGAMSPPTGVDLPDDFDASRQYVIPGCTTVELERYEFPAGPANPRLTALTMASVVARCLFTLESA